MRQMRFETLKKIFSWKRIMASWYRSYKIMFFIGFLMVLGLGGYFWYSNLYQYHWSDDKKKEFIEANFKATSFKESSFERLVASLKDRAVRHEKVPQLSRNIFSE
ncbi:MAG: hypothetical protein KBD65_02760 [Candidatus Moranbacteria bacterium]|nr:hypothetical protein [Candidatus Moranbacteria bacterium]